MDDTSCKNCCLDRMELRGNLQSSPVREELAVADDGSRCPVDSFNFVSWCAHTTKQQCLRLLGEADKAVEEKKQGKERAAAAPRGQDVSQVEEL